jgi:fructokinase
MSSTIVAFGEILWDLLPSGAVLGGAAFNFVCRIDSLGHRGVMVSRLGLDDL